MLNNVFRLIIFKKQKQDGTLREEFQKKRVTNNLPTFAEKCHIIAKKIALLSKTKVIWNSIAT